jgi:DNA-binding transcriptional LysR family regulator
MSHLCDFHRVLVCSPTYAGTQMIDEPEDLASCNALLFSDRELASEWVLQSRTGLSERKIEVSRNSAVRGFAALLGAAASGLGVARLPPFVAAPALADGTVVELLPARRTLPAPVYLAYRRGAARIGRMRALNNTATAEFPLLLPPSSS